MKKIVGALFFAVYALAITFTGTAFADPNCTGWTYYDSDSGTCVSCADSGFSITTTDLSANTNFWFTMSPKGSFAVDWGDGTVDNIDRNNTTATDYPHTYATGGVKTIKFCGRATEYNTATGDNVVAAISFYKTDSNNTSKWIASVSGSMGSVFPTVSNTPAGQPRFRSTFQGAGNLTTISANLFSGVSGSADGMFRSTFDKCTKLEAIPYGLFSGITGGASNMFRSAFYQCKGITSLPDDLFAGITVAKTDEFRFTFYQATGLKGKYIPATAFTGLVNAGHPSPATGNMWYQTFDGTGLIRTACPAKTHQFITGYEGTTANTTWNGYISCEPNNPCTGTNYWNSTNEVCVPCPNGYTYDTSDAKESINQCKIQCAAGTYIANADDATCTNAGVGYWAAGGVVNYGSTSSHTRCPDNMPTVNNTTTASSVGQCVVYCRGANYRGSNNSCIECPAGYDYDKDDGKTAITDCKIHCDGGTYLPTANASSCEDVGDGYWAAAATVVYGSTTPRTQCPNGQMTGTTNASSASQCIESLCTGATYRDSLTGECVSCPPGYDAHTVSGKTAPTDCQIHCVAGTYLVNANDTVCANVGDGYWAAASYINYGSAGTSARHQCPNGEPTGTQTATSELQCQTSCVGARYYNSATGQCADCPTGYTDNTTNGKNSITQCQHYCQAGSYAQTFTRIAYLESDGTQQFIDTGYEITGTHVNGVAVVATTVTNPAKNNYGNFFGNLYGPGGFSANHKDGNFGLWIQSKTKGEKGTYNTAFTVGQQYTLTYDVTTDSTQGHARLKVDGNNATPYPKSLDGVTINDEGNRFKLFTNGGATVVDGTVLGERWGDKLFGGRIYSLTLYENDVLVLDLVPVRRGSDGALGMFNRVNNEFYGNSGLGNFTAGSDIGEIFIECTPVGNGYYVGENYTNFGDTGARNKCPNNSPTMENGEIIHNATSIYQCDGVEPCHNAEYPNPSTGVCTQCPTGYDYNTQSNKESINECQTHCYAGTYLAAAYDATCSNVGDGYYAGEETINWGDIGTRTRCPNGGMTNTDTAESVAECQEVINNCTGATYMNFGICEPCPAGYTANTTDGKSSATDCQLICPEGSYLATARATTCTDAGVGYWATGGAVNYDSTSIRTQCTAGLTTVGYGHGADELADCGRKLHVGNYILYSKTTKPTTPAINIQPVGDNTVYYVGASANVADQTMTSVHITQGNTQYTAFDDSILHGERDIDSNTRITQ